MSLFSWFRPAGKPAHPSPESSGLSRMDPTRPAGKAPAAGDNARPANRKGERMARRELLYAVVRDAMVRAGVLSSSYKFKVLSLDARGRQFLVMVDLARDCGRETAQLAEIEALVAQAAKTKHDIVVTAIYWRMNEHVAIGAPFEAATQMAPAGEATPLPALPEAVSPPATVDLEPAPAVPPAPRGRFDPIDDEEVAAFRKALAEGTPRGPATAVAFDGHGVHGPQSYTLLTGFEDTEVADSIRPATTPQELSGTQYGELR